MARICFTGIAKRSIANWLPTLNILKQRGHTVHALIFPHTCDADSIGMEKLPFPVIGSIPIARSLRELPQFEARALADKALPLIRKWSPDLLMLTTCHAGPELELARHLMSDKGSTTVLGCQHGFVQNWSNYWADFQYDALMVFGELYVDFAPAELRQRLIAAALPKLDQVRPALPLTAGWRRKRILFAGQEPPSADIVRMLHDLRNAARAEVVIRPHPELRAAFSGLVPTTMLSSPDEPFQTALRRSSMLITTGSTSALEGLVARVPTIVVPDQRGSEYERAGIVANDYSANEILRIARIQRGRKWRAHVEDFLRLATGSAQHNRAQLAAERIEQLLVSKVLS